MTDLNNVRAKINEETFLKIKISGIYLFTVLLNLNKQFYQVKVQGSNG